MFSPGERDPGSGMGRLEGMVSRAQLQLLLDRQVYCDARGALLEAPSDPGAFARALGLAMAELPPPSDVEPSGELPEAEAEGHAASGSDGAAGAAARALSFDTHAAAAGMLRASAASAGGDGGHFLNLAPFVVTPSSVYTTTPATKVK